MHPMVESPDDATRAMQLAKSSGADPALVASDLGGVEERQKAAYTDQLLKNNPHLMDYVNSHPMAASVSNGDWGNLDKFSQTLQGTAKFNTIARVAKDFAEGMALDRPIGLFGMEEPSLDEVYAHPAWAAGMLGLQTLGALPDLGFRAVGGAINAAAQSFRRVYEKATGESGEEGTNNFIQAISDPALVQSLGPEASAAAEAFGVGLRHMQELKKIAPYLKAGEVPPGGVSEIVDKALQQEGKDFQKSLKEQTQAASGTNLIEQDPDLFRNFVNQHAPEHIELQADAVRTILGDKAAEPGDGKFGDIPGFNEELALAERHNGHVQVPLADWFLYANKNPDEAKFLEKYVSRPGGVTEAEGELAKEREAAKPEEEEAQTQEGEEPRTVLPNNKEADWKTEPLMNIPFDTKGHADGLLMGAESGRLIKLNDEGERVRVSLTNSSTAGPASGGFVKPQFSKAVHDVTDLREELDKLYKGKEQQPLPAEEVNPHAAAMDSVRAASGLDFQTFGPNLGIIPDGAIKSTLTAGGKVYPTTHFLAGDAFKMIDKDRLHGLPRALAEFFHDRMDRMAGDTPVVAVEPKTMQEINKRFKIGHDAPAIYSPDDNAIIMREDLASGMAFSHGTATHVLVHETAHAATYHAMREFPEIKVAVEGVMAEADKFLKENLPERREAHNYAFRNADEFVAETFSNPKFEEVLASTPITPQMSEVLSKGLGHLLQGKNAWDAMMDIINTVIEKLVGKRLPPSALDEMMKIGKALQEAKRQMGKGKVRADEQALGAEPIEGRKAFKTPATVGLKADDLREYMGLIEKQQKVEQDHIEAKALEDERRRQTAEWKENEKRVKSEVRAGVNKQPAIVADRYLREGVLPEGKVGKENQFKIDKGALTDEQLRTLSPDYYSSRGASPDDIAKLAGFGSGDSLVQALGDLHAQRELEGLTPQAHITKMVNIATEHEMQRQYGDLEENILREAKEHVFSPSQIDILADETVKLATLAKSELPISKEDLLKGARQVFDASPLRAVSSKAFEASMGRAGQAVQDALRKGDARAALKAKQEQTNAAIYANLALKWEKYLKRFTDTDAPRWGRREPPGTRPEDAVWMHQILYQLLGPDGIQTSKQDLERRKEMVSSYKTLRDYVEAKNKGHGTASTDPNNPTITHQLNVSDNLFSENWPGKKFEALSVDEARSAIDSIKSIDHYSHGENTYTVKGDKVALKEVVSGLVERLKAAVDNKTAVDDPHETSVFRNIGSLLLNTETWMNRLDLGNRQGPFNQLIIRPIVEGQYELRQHEKDFAARWKDLGEYPDFNKSVTNTLFKDKNGYIEMTKGNAYVVLQNMGNALQRMKLIKGWGIDADQAVGEQKIWDWLKNTAGMTKEDLARAQKMGKIFNDAFALSEKAYTHTAGVAPARIELYKVQTPWGEADEWYHPLVADPLRNQSHWTVEEAMQNGNSGFWKPSPAAGYTKGRTGAVYPIDLSFKTAAYKLRQILNDAAMRIPITEVSKLVYNKEFQEAFKRYYGPEYHSALDAWMKDSAGNRQWQPANIATLDRWVSSIAQNMSTALIGFNPSTVLKHGPTAAIFSAWETGPLNWASSMLHIIKEMPGSRQTWNWVMDTSEEARNRLHHIEDTLSNQNRELFSDKKGGIKGKISSFRDAVSWYGHYPVGFADLISAVAMFHAEYKRLNKLDPTMTDGDLRYAANTAIRRTHGSSIVSNRSGIQRHYSPFVRLSMPFYNFLSNAMQRNYENAWMSKLSVQGRELPEMTGFLK